MKLFNDTIPLVAEGISLENIEVDELGNIIFTLHKSKELLSNFESKYEERKVDTINIVFTESNKDFYLLVIYSNNETILLRDDGAYSFVLTKQEKEMLSFYHNK